MKDLPTSVLSMNEGSGYWRSERVTRDEQLIPLVSHRPLIVYYPGGLDPNDFPSYQAAEKSLSRELGANVWMPDFYDLPGVQRVGSNERGPVYYGDFKPQDRFNQVAAKIAHLQPVRTVLAGFGFGATEAIATALALQFREYPVRGVIAHAPMQFFDQPESYGPVKNLASGKVDETMLHDTTPPEDRNNPLRQRLSCVRYYDVFDPQSSPAITVHINGLVRERYRHPLKGLLPFANNGSPEFDNLYDLVASSRLNGLYTLPTLFLAGGDDRYVPRANVRALAETDHIPTRFKELPGIKHDWRGKEGQIRVVVDELLEAAGRLLTTGKVENPKTLNAMLVMGAQATASEPRSVVVLSGSRPAVRQGNVIEVAAKAGMPLIALTSHNLRPHDVVKSMRKLGAVGLVAEVPPGFELDMTKGFASPEHPAVAERTSNLWIKRNIGLLAADIERDRNVIYSDDDIRWMPEDLAWADAILTTFDVAGFLPKHFPDKSVVYHADYLAGGDPELAGVSISGNSLAVAARAAAKAFFDKGYNEDRAHLARFVPERSAAYLGEVRQLDYDPFANPARAASEVFGDLLADGLFYLQGLGLPYREVGEEFWKFQIARYRLFIDDITRRLITKSEHDDIDGRIERALVSMHAAKIKLETYTARDFASYVRDRDDDTDRWQERYAMLPKGMPLAESLVYHGLSVQVVGRPKSRVV